MREKTCCFTGHRQIPAEYLPAISEKLRDTLIFYIEQGYQYFGAGGALGFDTLAAQTVLHLKQRYPCIKLILVLPCKDQAAKWRASDVKEYERIKSHADKIVYFFFCLSISFSIAVPIDDFSVKRVPLNIPCLPPVVFSFIDVFAFFDTIRPPSNIGAVLFYRPILTVVLTAEGFNFD